MSAVFSNEVAVHMFLEQEIGNENGGVHAPLKRAGSSITLTRSGSTIFRAGSFSEVMAKTHDEERAIFDTMFPEIIEDKDRKTFYSNPLAMDNDPTNPLEYVIPEPDERMGSGPRKSTKFASLLGLFRSDSPPTPTGNEGYDGVRPKSRAYSARSIASLSRHSFSRFNSNNYSSSSSTPTSRGRGSGGNGSGGRDPSSENNAQSSFVSESGRGNTRPFSVRSLRVKLNRAHTSPPEDLPAKRPMSQKIKGLFRRGTDLK